MSLTLPANTYKIGQPLLASGISGHGNMLFVESLSQNQIRFGLDEWGSNLFTNSSILNIDSNTEHLIEVFVGPQVTKQKIEADWAIRNSDLKLISSELQVWLDGKLAWQTTIHGNHDTYNNVGVGTNPQGFSTTQGVFGGVFKNTPFSDLEKKDFGIDIENKFQPKYIVSADKKKIVTELKKLAKDSKMVWLASDEASFITGTSLMVDGGLSIM
jgi:hypothetical protein